jgi:RNA polymerase sigma-70 factor (ECF subfamily)
MQNDSGELDISRLLGGDRQSWGKFVDRYAPIIYSAIFKLLKTYRGFADPEQAADLTQVAFMNLVKDNNRLLRNFDARKASMATWLRLIARSRSLDVLRKRRIVTESLDDLVHEPKAPTPSAMPEIDIPANLLSARQMLIMRLLFDKDLEVEQVAKLLKISAQTVRSTKHKALIKLRIYYANVDRDPNKDD